MVPGINNNPTHTSSLLSLLDRKPRQKYAGSRKKVLKSMLSVAVSMAASSSIPNTLNAACRRFSPFQRWPQ